MKSTLLITLSLFSLQLNVNIDVRLIQVNERLAKHKLLAAVADWVQNCSGNLQVDLEWFYCGRLGPNSAA